MGMKKVIVHIDRLVLTGLHDSDRKAIARGLQQQLSQALSVNGMADALDKTGHIPRLQLEPVQLPAEAGSQQMGRSLANAIGNGLGK
jgi:hypothetical protein